MGKIDPEVRAVFFDAVGTILFPRSPVGQTYREIGRKFGLNFSEEQVRHRFREAFARQEQQDFQAGLRTNEDRERARWQAIVADVLPTADSDAFFAELWDWFASPAAWKAHPEAAEVLADLSGRSVCLGLASNFDARLLSLVGAMPELAPLRERCVVSSLVGWRKPSGEFFQAVARVAGHPPGQILYVGDDLRNDIHGASAAGMKALLFDPDGDVETEPTIRRLRDLLPE